MEDVRTVLALLGTFLPVFGMAAVAYVAWLGGPGRRRWIVLAAGPALTLILIMTFVKGIFETGHMLAAVMFLGFVAFLCVYYPALIVAGAVTLIRRRRRS